MGWHNAQRQDNPLNLYTMPLKAMTPFLLEVMRLISCVERERYSNHISS